MKRTINQGIMLLLVFVASILLSFTGCSLDGVPESGTGSAARAAVTICGQYDTVSVVGGQYTVQNNVWGATTAQCITVPDTNATGFVVSTSAHNQGSVAAYPSIYKGCHWGACTSSSGMPLLVSQVSSAPMSFSVSSARPDGNYNVATEAWLSPSSDSSSGYNGGCELMIVLDYHGMYPAGSQVGTFSGYNVFFANIGWNFVTYVKTGTSSVSVNIKDFMNDAQSRGYLQSSWYLHDFEAGFEIMSGGQGLTANSFSFSVSGGGTVPTPTPTPTYTVTPTPTPTTGVPCSNPTSISIPYTRDGSGDFCWSFSATPAYINSWNLAELSVNGVNFTNRWVSGSSLPAKINGLYYVRYRSNYAWGHAEIR